MELRRYEVTITTTGSAGSATGSETITVAPPGYIEWVDYDFHASAPATTDVTGTMAAGANPPGEVVFTSPNSATDVLQFPRAAAVNLAGTAITNSHVPVLVSGALAIAVAQCDALAGAVVVTVGVRES